MNLTILVTIIAAVIAVTDILLGMMFWKRYRALADYAESPEVQGTTPPEVRAQIARKAQAMRMAAIAMAASAVVIPVMLAGFLALGLMPA